MFFELSQALIDQLLFAMEDQDGDPLLDTVDLLVIDRDQLTLTDSADACDGDVEPGRYIKIPAWRSADGFRLMERYTSSLRNQLVREQLSIALDQGRGVFRAFKDVLTKFPEIEKRWFFFKEKEMRRVILSWYNSLRDEWGLKRIGEEPEDTADLVLEDFRFRATREEDFIIADALFEDRLRDMAIPLELVIGSERLTAARLRGADQWLALTVETARGDFAGIAVAVALVKPAVTLPMSYQIVRLEVVPEYRGLGLGEELIFRLRESLTKKHPELRIFMDLPSSSNQFSRVLARLGFTVYETRYCFGQI